MSEQVQEIAVTALHGFKDHPFQVKEDESFQYYFRPLIKRYDPVP